MELFLARIFDGFASGSTYALIALALVLIYKATTLINFAQGELAMLGAFLALELWSHGVPVWFAVILAMVLSALLAAGIERTLIRPFDPKDHLPLVIITSDCSSGSTPSPASSGVSIRGPFPQMFPSGNVIAIGAATLSWYTVCTFLTVLAVLYGLTQLLNRTKIGLAFRGVSSNLESSELVGIRVGPTLQFGWALAAAVGTLGAAIYVADPAPGQLEPSVMGRG
ncbi:MAG: branched-chain amino acid ABC transporter permease [Ilumatobacteraceae bacterium]